MPTRKSSPSKTKKSPAKSPGRPRSRSRSRSTARKPTTKRSRSRSVGRPRKTAVAEESPVVAQTKTSTRTARSRSRSAGRVTSTKTTTVVTESKNELRPETPTRVSRRIQEQIITKTSAAATQEQGDGAKRTGSPTSGTGPGQWGGLAVLIVIGISFYLAMACTEKQCTLLKLPLCTGKWQDFFDCEVMGMVLAFFAAVCVVSMVPVGAIVQGQPLNDGRRLEYRCNGWLVLLVTVAAFVFAVQRGCPMGYLHQNFLKFVSSSLILSTVLALSAFIWGRNAPARDRSPGSDGTFLNDFWMGRELNPRICNLDMKQILFRFGVVLWLLINWMYLVDRFQVKGRVEPALALCVMFQTIYGLLAFRNEYTMYSSTDFMAEGGGFLFAWAGIAFTPFLCTIMTRFLYMYPSQGLTNQYALGAVFLLNMVGLAFFVGANWQKNAFRANPYSPELSHLSSIPTATGKRILSSGWWGIVRRPNYLGDLMMAYAWSAVCGCNYAFPWFYPAYLTMLLVARCINDEASCRQRYGDAWDKYTSQVKYRLIPCVW